MESSGQTGKIRVRGEDIEVDNRWVVRYCPKLLRTFQRHMNVEKCISRVGSIKYLFKYVCKGSDRVTIGLQDEAAQHNEINSFIDARYVSLLLKWLCKNVAAEGFLLADMVPSRVFRRFPKCNFS